MVAATTKISSDASIKMMPQSAPGVPGRIACGEHQGHQASEDCGDRVLDRDHLVVLAPDILGPEALRPVRLFNVGISHHCPPFCAAVRCIRLTCALLPAISA